MGNILPRQACVFMNEPVLPFLAGLLTEGLKRQKAFVLDDHYNLPIFLTKGT
jgi:hypothetical protein